MKQKQYIINLTIVLLVLLSSFSIVIGENTSESMFITPDNTLQISAQSTYASDQPSAIMVTDADPFYALIATPIAVHYDAGGNQHVIPLYVLNFTNPSSAVAKAQEQIGIYPDLVIGDIFTLKESSILYSTLFWEEAESALIIEDSQQGYNLGVLAAPIASYLGIPILVTDEIDHSIEQTLTDLNVEKIYICGDLSTTSFDVETFNTVQEVIDEIISIHQNIFNEPITYLTFTNPEDTKYPKILKTETYNFQGTIASGVFLPTQLPSMILKQSAGSHTFTIPSDYKYAKLTIELRNLNSEHVEELGDEIVFLLNSPEGFSYTYGGTMGGIPDRDSSEDITLDQITYDTVIYDNPGEYTINVFGKWFARKTGSYSVKITVEKLDSPIVPLMKRLSSMTPYITAYHKGIIFGKPEFAFAADDHVTYQGQTCPGVSQPGSNPNLIVPSNQHTFTVHAELLNILSQIAGIPTSPLKPLREHYKDNPINIAIAADPTMIPMYFYYNPDGRTDNPGAYMMGFALPSDFIYGDIDPDINDPENDTLSYWPFQENILARLTGRDVQDMSALIARTIYYNRIINKMGSWKDSAVIGTGCGLEFQNLPLFTRITHLIYGGRGEPTKFPTGESTFINLRISDMVDDGFPNTKSTFLTVSQRVGFSEEDLDLIKDAGILNKILFPKNSILAISSDTLVTGGQDHIDSNLIFSFAHGSYNLFEHGDVLMDARGFPMLTILTRIYPPIRSGLSAKGAFDVRGVENMNYGPSTMFVVSCITGRTDGLNPTNTISQTMIHAGVNAYVGATRVTADPGYLEPRPLPGGWGIGTLGLIKATMDLLIKDEYPTFHFGAVLGEDFIKEMIENDKTTGLALRDAKNVFLPKDANSTFYWTPPLMFTTGVGWLDDYILSSLDTTNQNKPFEETRVLDKKYVCFHEFTLYGDPAFNPYQTINNG